MAKKQKAKRVARYKRRKYHEGSHSINKVGQYVPHSPAHSNIPESTLKAMYEMAKGNGSFDGTFAEFQVSFGAGQSTSKSNNTSETTQETPTIDIDTVYENAVSAGYQGSKEDFQTMLGGGLGSMGLGLGSIFGSSIGGNQGPKLGSGSVQTEDGTPYIPSKDPNRKAPGSSVWDSFKYPEPASVDDLPKAEDLPESLRYTPETTDVNAPEVYSTPVTEMKEPTKVNPPNLGKDDDEDDEDKDPRGGARRGGIRRAAYQAGGPTQAFLNTKRTVERQQQDESVKNQPVRMEQTQGVSSPTIQGGSPVPSPTFSAPTARQAASATAAQVSAPTPIQAATYQPDLIAMEDVPQVQAAQGTVSDEAIAQFQRQDLTERAVAAERDAAQEQAALTKEAAQYEISDGAYVDKVTGTVTDVAPTKEAEVAQREAILGKAAQDAEAAQILERLNYDAVQVRSVKGTAAKGAAAEMVAEVGQLPPELSATIVEDPQTVEAQIDDQPIEVKAAVAALPTEALVSSQMETLLGGIEDGEVPVWARPAVEQVNRMLAQRGLTASTVGRDALLNSIIQSAMPIAQSNAQALQARAAQNLNNEQQAVILEAQQRQERAMFNAQTLANIDMARFSAQQQTALANSAFMQTMTVRDFDANQQTAMQNATAYANMDLANLNAQERAAAQNAQAFLQMDMTNLANEQQARVLNQQLEQQTLLSNQAAENAARQFNAANQQQADQFIASLGAQVSQFNASQQNAMTQFNTSEQNRIAAQNAQNATQVALANAQMATEISRFNAQMDQQREQFNTANAQAIEQADIAWRRQTNTINTAAQNAANQQNVMNAFNMSMAELQFVWQELRDNAAYTRQAYENDQTRRTQLYATAIGNEAAASGQKNSTTTNTVIGIVERILRLGG